MAADAAADADLNPRLTPLARSQHPAMLRAVHGLKAAQSPSTSFFLLSNSNTVYIDTILKVRALPSLPPRTRRRLLPRVRAHAQDSTEHLD